MKTDTEEVELLLDAALVRDAEELGIDISKVVNDSIKAAIEAAQDNDQPEA